MSLIARIRAGLTVPMLLVLHNVVVRPGGRCRCPIHGGRNPQAFAVDSDGRRWRCFSCGLHGDVIDLVAALEGVPLGDAIRRCAVLAGIDPDLRESAVERAVRRSRDEERAAEAQEIELHRRALRSALADTHRHLDEHRARLRAAGPLGPPNEVEQGLLDYCDYLEMELRELRRRPDWELADLWAGWRVENAVALLLRGQSDAA